MAGSSDLIAIRQSLASWFSNQLGQISLAEFSAELRMSTETYGDPTGPNDPFATDLSDDDTAPPIVIGMSNAMMSMPGSDVTQDTYDRSPGYLESKIAGGLTPLKGPEAVKIALDAWLPKRLDKVPDAAFTAALKTAIDDLVKTSDPTDPPNTPSLVQAFVTAVMAMVPAELTASSFSEAMGTELQDTAMAIT